MYKEKRQLKLVEACGAQALPKPRAYRKQARKAYLKLSKGKNHATKQVRSAIKAQLQFIRRDVGYIPSGYGISVQTIDSHTGIVQIKDPNLQENYPLYNESFSANETLYRWDVQLDQVKLSINISNALKLKQPEEIQGPAIPRNALTMYLCNAHYSEDGSLERFGSGV